MSRAPETGRPRNEPPYPVVLTASDERRARSIGAWTALSSASVPPEPELQPVTASLRALPAGSASLPRLPRVGGVNGAEPTEEELRESLRRFVVSAAPLLGASPDDLTLVARTDEPGGARRAVYEQRPFPFPLRGGFGRIEITFAPDLRVTALTSTAIPEAARLRTALEAVRPVLTAADAAQRVAGNAVSVRAPDGPERTLAVNPAEAAPRELVVLPLASPGGPASLALHLAWEVAVGRDAQAALVYVDAVTGATLAAVTAPPNANTPGH